MAEQPDVYDNDTFSKVCAPAQQRAPSFSLRVHCLTAAQAALPLATGCVLDSSSSQPSVGHASIQVVCPVLRCCLTFLACPGIAYDILQTDDVLLAGSTEWKEMYVLLTRRP